MQYMGGKSVQARAGLDGACLPVPGDGAAAGNRSRSAAEAMAHLAPASLAAAAQPGKCTTKSPCWCSNAKELNSRRETTRVRTVAAFSRRATHRAVCSLKGWSRYCVLA